MNLIMVNTNNFKKITAVSASDTVLTRLKCLVMTSDYFQDLSTLRLTLKLHQ